MSTDNKIEWRFLVTFKHEARDYMGRHSLHLTADLVYINEEGELRSSYGTELADLAVTALACDDMRTGLDDTYGWSVDFRNVYGVDLVRAEQMVKVLRKIAKGLAAKEATGDWPTSFAYYLTAVARILGVKSLGWKIDPDNRHDTGYRWGGSADLVYKVREEVAKVFATEDANAS